MVKRNVYVLVEEGKEDFPQTKKMNKFPLDFWLATLGARR